MGSTDERGGGGRGGGDVGEEDAGVRGDVHHRTVDAVEQSPAAATSGAKRRRTRDRAAGQRPDDHRARRRIEQRRQRQPHRVARGTDTVGDRVAGRSAVALREW